MISRWAYGKEFVRAAGGECCLGGGRRGGIHCAAANSLARLHSALIGARVSLICECALSTCSNSSCLMGGGGGGSHVKVVGDCL